MNIPDQVIIGGLCYRVERISQTALGLQAEGTISPREQLITVCDTGTDYAKVTFLHECIHGMMEAIGIPLYQHKERLVDSLAHQLYQFLRDNTGLISHNQP